MDVADQSAWRDTVKRITQGLAIRSDELNATRRETAVLLQSLEADLAKSSRRFHQVQLLRNVSGDTPWAVRSILLQLQDLHDDLNLKARPLVQLKEQLVRSRGDDPSFLDIQEDIAAKDPTSYELEELKPTLERLKTLRMEEEAVLKDADAGLASAVRLLDRVAAAQEREREHVIRALSAYYFEQYESLLTAAGRDTAMSEMRTWANDFPQFATMLIRWIRWDEALGFTLTCFIVLYWILPGLWRRSRGQGEGRTRPSPRNPGWLVFSLGLAAVMAFRIGLFTLNQFTSLGALTLCTLGLVIALEYTPGNDSRRSWLCLGSRLFALWTLFAAGALALAMSVPPTPLGLYSAVSSLLAALYLYRLKTHGEKDARNTSLSLLTALLILFAMIAPFGFGPQTLILGQALFMLMLTLRAMDAAKKRLYEADTTEDDSRKAPGVSVMAYPLVAAVLGFLFILWVFMFIGGPGFLQHMLAHKWAIGSMSLSIESLGMILILFFALRLAMAWIKLASVHTRFKGERLNPAMAHTVNATVSYFAWTLFILLSIHLLGVPLSSLTWIASGLSVGVGFGLKDIVNNFISGLIILFGGAIKKGDVIQQGKNLGEVIDVSVRNTTIRTPDNTMVIIPNSTFLRGEIINLSYQDTKTRLTIPVTVVPGTKVKKVIKILLAAARKNENVLKDPPPEASLVRFGRMGLEFELYVWIENFLKKFETEADLVTKIDRQFQDEKVMLSFQGVKIKYKPKGNEEQQLESQREAIRAKRKKVLSRVRPLRSVYTRLRWNVATVATHDTED
ncbi:mechanosensitive ion channel family protein [Fundidesulfovibrio terrae]|uniref:mechanosensitive ion channel family protein n=1 Tax=Fundidesulfovibrio terrae TaxID=2922866 RepID=UPI001FAF8F3D